MGKRKAFDAIELDGDDLKAFINGDEVTLQEVDDSSGKVEIHRVYLNKEQILKIAEELQKEDEVQEDAEPEWTKEIDEDAGVDGRYQKEFKYNRESKKGRKYSTWEFVGWVDIPNLDEVYEYKFKGKYLHVKEFEGSGWDRYTVKEEK